MAASERIAVTVVYALPDRQHIVEVRVPPGATVETAIEVSGLLVRFPQAGHACAIYGRVVPRTHVLAEGDRVEILRPLHMDPKEARRRAARERAAR